MQMKRASCPVCGSAKSCIVYRVDRHHRRDLRPEIAIAKCNDCETAYLNQVDHSFQEDLYAYYERFAGKPMDELVSSLNLANYQLILRMFLSTVSFNPSLMLVVEKESLSGLQSGRVTK